MFVADWTRWEKPAADDSGAGEAASSAPSGGAGPVEKAD
jgi:hypothetical protein